MDKVLFSRNSDNWRTPKAMYDKYIYNLGYYDPCPYKADFDCLDMEWKDKNFVNPPYSKIKDFVNKAIEEHEKGKEVILLIPARTDTKYFRNLVEYGVNIIFITGRLHFNDSNSAPFPSCLVCLTHQITICQWKNRSVYE